jgi:hypothetical protein
VSEASGNALNQMYSLTSECKGAQARRMVGYLARALVAQMVRGIVEHYRRSPMRINQAIIEFETRLRNEKPLRKEVHQLEKNLSKQPKKKCLIMIA